MKNITNLLAVAVLTLVSFSSAFGQQQQYANAYAYWEFAKEIDSVENVEQSIWIAKPAPASQWVLMWSWVADPAHGGYFGFNTDSSGKGQALFSLWNADKAIGEHCKEFGGEGVGWSCRMPFDIKPNVIYKLRLARTRTDAEGVWWGGWITEASTKERSIGEIRVKKEMNTIRPGSIMNFSEYFGDVREKCRTVPFSIFAVAPPTMKKERDGKNYSHAAGSSGSSDPKSNPCQTGDEPEGNLFKVVPFDFAGTNGALIFLGGARTEHRMPEKLAFPGQ